MQWRCEALFSLLVQGASWMFHYYVSKLRPKSLTPLRGALAHSGSRIGSKDRAFSWGRHATGVWFEALSLKTSILQGLISCEISQERNFVSQISQICTVAFSVLLPNIWKNEQVRSFKCIEYLGKLLAVS